MKLEVVKSCVVSESDLNSAAHRLGKLEVQCSPENDGVRKPILSLK